MLSSQLKKLLQKTTGYWIYKKKHLPFGIDPVFDLSQQIQLKDNPVVFDVGANTGQTVHRFKTYFPKSTIYSFEPVRSIYEELQEKVKAFKGVKTEQLALGGAIAEQTIYFDPEYSEQSSLVSIQGDMLRHQETVKVDTIDNYASEHTIQTIDFLKTDTEGFDLEVLKGASTLLKEKRIRFIFSEVGFYKNDSRHTHFSDLLEYLKEQDYYFFGLYNVRLLGPHCYANALFFDNAIELNNRIGKDDVAIAY